MPNPRSDLFFLDHHPTCWQVRFRDPSFPDLTGLLDTGANMSLMSMAVLNFIFDGHPPPLDSTSMTSVEGLGSASLRGSLVLPIFVDAVRKGEKVVVEMQTTFFIVDEFGPGFCIGLDVLHYYGADVLLSEGVVRLPTEAGRATAPIEVTKKKPPRYSPHPAKAAAAWASAYATKGSATGFSRTLSALKTTVVPPRSHVFIPVNELPGGRNIVWMSSPRFTLAPSRIESGSGQASLILPSATGKKGNGLAFTNFSDRPFLVPKGLPLADATVVPSSWIRKTGKVFAFNDPALEPTTTEQGRRWDPNEEGVEPPAPETSKAEPPAPERGNAFDPNDEDDGEWEKRRAKVEAEHPSRKVEGCQVALDENGEPYTPIVDVLQEFSDVLSKDGKPGRVTIKPVKIPLTDENAIRAEGLRPLPPAKRAFEKSALQEFLEDDVIEPSSSHLSFPVVIVRQGDKMRYCIDYRQLNKFTVRDAYPMQRADVLFASLGGSRFFSSLDAARGYHQIEIDPEERWKTAFVTHQGFFQWKTMPFGLTNAPAIFQRLMDSEVLGSLRWLCALVYIDDVVIFTRTLDEHVAALRHILENARRIGLKFSAKKCFLAYPSIKLLGRIISPDGLSVILDRVKAMRQLKRPTTLAELYHVLGVFGFYRAFVPSYARKMAPLTKLTKGLVYEKGANGKTALWRKLEDGSRVPVRLSEPIEWGDEQEAAFVGYLDELLNPPTLAFPMEGYDYTVYCDASHHGISAILHQLQPRVKPQPRGLGDAAAFPLLGDSMETKIAKAQREDKLFQPFYDALSEGQEKKPYRLHHGVLVVDLEAGTRWCLPESLISQALHDLHDRLGHPGIAKTWDNVSSRFWRPGLYVKTRDYCNSCDGCQRSKSQRSLPAGQMDSPREVPPIAFGTVSMDLVTGLPTSTRNHDAVLVVRCLWTHAMILIPTTSNMTAQRLATHWFDDVISKGFAPAKIISDRGPQFMSEFWAALQDQLGASLVFSAAYHQQANPVERAVQTMQTMLRIYCKDDPKQWHNHLKFVELTMNSIKSDTTGEVPYDLVYVSRHSPWARLQDPAQTPSDVLEEAKRRCRQALAARAKAFEVQRDQYNKRHSPPPSYRVGDEVMVLNKRRPGVDLNRQASKLRQINRGPWKIRKILSPVAVELELPDELSQISPVFSVEQIKPYVARPTAADEELSSDEELDPPTTLDSPATDSPTENPSTTDSPTSSAKPSPSEAAGQDDATASPPENSEPQRASRRRQGQDRVRWDPRSHQPQTAAASANKDLVERLIACYSRRVTKTEKNYNITELELLGLKVAILVFRYFLDGAPYIKVVTDHQPLVTILSSSKDLVDNKRAHRFRIALQGFNLHVVYKEGAKHSNADALSRLDSYEGPDPFSIFEGGPPSKLDDPFNTGVLSLADAFSSLSLPSSSSAPSSHKDTGRHGTVDHLRGGMSRGAVAV